MSHKRNFLCLLYLLWLIPPPQYSYRVVKTYPHDSAAFTQGLEYRDGFLYEGTGMPGRSSIRKVDLATGRVLQTFDVPPPLLGEGITVLNQQIFELTYTSQTGFGYRQANCRAR